MSYRRPSVFYYRVTQAASGIVSSLVFRRKFLRNEIRGVKGPFVVIANHECMLDFVNLIGATERPMSFVISNSFYNTVPVKGIMDKIGVIPKQQFQTSVTDLKQIKAVVDAGEPVVIYPAGLMCEDGLSTPIPAATYKFLKWLGADVYVARCSGSYFVMPKWTSGMRPGKTTMDIYKLFSKEELADMDLDTIRKKTDGALLFDAYREQDAKPQKYSKNGDIRGLEQVLYVCPHCHEEFTMVCEGKNMLRCTQCGYAQRSDAMGLLHKESDHGPEMRYVSDWSRWIYRRLRRQLEIGEEVSLSSEADIHMIDYEKHKFVPVGQGRLSLSPDGFTIDGIIRDEEISIRVPVGSVPTLPFKPGKYLEIQQGKDIYRCLLSDGKLVMKFINLVKIYYELHQNELNKEKVT